jgi:hypothetical protein
LKSGSSHRCISTGGGSDGIGGIGGGSKNVFKIFISAMKIAAHTASTPREGPIAKPIINVISNQGYIKKKF